LWEGSLVMIDKETKSLWSHLLGEAMQGELTGSVLTQIPSVMTNWAEWRRRYPKTSAVVLSKTSFDYTSENYKNGHFLLIGLATNSVARAWFSQLLQSHRTVNDKFGDRPVLVAHETTNGTSVIFDRTVGKRVLTFEWKENKLVDRETGSHWDLITGKATAGPLRGRTLTLMPGIVSFEQAWKSFHPKSTYWLPTENGSTNNRPR
jgi:hypothetical protein